MKAEKYIKQVNKFNEFLKSVTDRCQTNEVYLDKSSTIISAPEEITPIEIVEQTEHSVRFANNILDWVVEEEWDEEEKMWYISFVTEEEHKDNLKWTKRCVNNGLKFFQAEDPDRFLEEDDNEED